MKKWTAALLCLCLLLLPVRFSCRAETAESGPSVGAPSALLMTLSGRTHSVYTGICLIRDGQEYTAVDMTAVHFLPLTREAVDRYIVSGEWQGKAGAYAVQGRAMAFADRLEGSAANVIGLPVHAVVALAEENGINLYGD